MSTMRKPIIIRGGFATPYDVADLLGVSRKRADELIAMARETGRKPAAKSKVVAKKSATKTNGAPKAAR